MDVIEAIAARRSVRNFTGEEVTDAELDTILDAGRLAPSGLNNQPWCFAIVRDEKVKNELSGFSHYGRLLTEANVLVAVFFRHDKAYNRDKDMHGIGACIENMWLAATSIGIGMCWLGEILARHEDVEKTIGVPGGHELMAVLCLGHPKKDSAKRTDRLPLEKLVIKRL